ncbi:hypothetical protein FACS1894121_0790 [Bacteroidia bacterium]|nr:hypothetical protein FACS1894121_0790 [Bacteroidia bacterium]
MNMYNKLRKLLSLDTYYTILRTDLSTSYVWMRFLQKSVATLIVSVHRYLTDKCTLSASALTYHSILAVIPILALVLAIARGFGLSKFLESQLREQSFANPEVMEMILNFANSTLENVNSGIVTGVGVALLVWSVMSVLGTTESVMNKIWGINKGRNLKRQITDYLSVLFIAPILLVVASGINVFLSTNLQAIAKEEGFLQYTGNFIMHLIKWTPYVLVWCLFVFLYMFVPTTKVRFKHALVGGILAGTVFQVVQWVYLSFQIGVSKYNTIYGSLAAFPLLLMWLQLSWSIILWGTEFCFVLKNRHFLFYNASPQTRWTENIEKVINILRYISTEYSNNKGAIFIGDISKEYKINISKLQILLGHLTDKQILTEIKKEDDDYYLPLINMRTLSVAEVIIGLIDMDEENKSVWEEKYLDAIREKFGNEYITE